jgi:murein L,D-transpeptidase YcbB/YkuD
MENFKYILSSIIVISVLAYGGYWAFSTLESGTMHIDNQRQKELENKNKELTNEVTVLKRELALLQADKIQIIQDQNNNLAPLPQEIKNGNTTPPTNNPPTNTTVYKDQTLINELQKLVDNNVYLKNKSQGPAVGSIQTFLNIYKNTKDRVDNDYGAKTVEGVKTFQKDQGITVDGEIGPGTLKRMITWLKSR